MRAARGLVLAEALLAATVPGAAAYLRPLRLQARANATNTTTDPMFQLSTDESFAFQLEVTLALANGGGAATGEVLRAASQITAGDYDSYYDEFSYLGDEITKVCVGVDSKKFPVSAREACFRAASYYRSAGFYLIGNPSDPRIISLWDKQIANFDKAISLLPIPGERLNISANGFNIPVLFYKAQNSNEKTPTVLAGSGYDGAQEDLYHGIGQQVLARGWNFATYEGPGQPTVRKYQNIGFISEWWEAVTPVVDYLYNRSDVDTSKLALLGESYGGILAPRAASHEHRFAAVLAIDGLYNLQKRIREQLLPSWLALYDSGNKTAFDYTFNVIRKTPSAPTNLRWLIDQGLFSFKTNSPYDWFTRFGEINLDGILENVTAPLFVGKGNNDDITLGQPELVGEALNKLGKPYYYHAFRTELGAGEHCQIGAEHQYGQVALDWLAEVFDGNVITQPYTNGTNSTVSR